MKGEETEEEHESTTGPNWPTVLALFIVCATVVVLCYIVRVT